MPDPNPPPPAVPRSRTATKKKTRLSLVWIIPIVAALGGAWVAVVKIRSEGPTITIVFKSAEGLDAGKTKIHYNGVEVGTLMKIRLSDDHKQAIATAAMAPGTESFLVEDTNFWIETARISGATVSGLGTLISGAYIGMDIGSSQKRKSYFVALDTPPVVTSEVPGRFFVLKTQDLGSLDRGTPIFFRRLQVGQVVSYELDKDGQTLTLKVFVNAPYDQYVNPDTRFWQASGIDVSLSASGLSVQTQSVLSLLIGGIAFETPVTGAVLRPAEATAVFTLFRDRARAFEPPPTHPGTFVLVFKQSVRGLAPGAPVEFRGIQIGEVTEITAEADPKTAQFSIAVTITLDAVRLGVKMPNEPTSPEAWDAMRRNFIDTLVSRGFRAQLRTGNLLTGALYVAIDAFPEAPPTTVDWSQKPARLPTIPGEIEQIEASLVNLVKKLEKVPVEDIGQEAKKALVDLRGTLAAGTQTLDTADKTIAPNSALSNNLSETLGEVSRAAGAIRVLADYLERHPESLLRGKSGEGK
jgi:paraquat-inducible protein B